jgi:creatinine amidohydrolase
MDEREIRYEYLRPEQLIEERERCPLIFLPVAPLEYHGPHLPVGVDPINATHCALETCRRLGKGVVLPTTYMGTERERPEWMLQSLGFKKNDWIVGMDFPTALWQSHYYREHVFALVMAEKIEMMIRHEYKVIIIVNGHGALNQLETLDRLARRYSNVTDSLVDCRLAFSREVTEKNMAGHADLYETSLLMYFQDQFHDSAHLVDLSRLPPRDVPIRYQDFSIVDGPGFTEEPHPERIVQTDPRDASEEQGKKLFEDTVEMYVRLTRESLKKKGLK